MLWVKKDNNTYQSIGHNLHIDEKGEHEVWITRPTGKTTCIFTGNEERAKVIYDAMNFAILKDLKLVEL